jgi:hypothetical protein
MKCMSKTDQKLGWWIKLISTTRNHNWNGIILQQIIAMKHVNFYAYNLLSLISISEIRSIQ